MTHNNVSNTIVSRIMGSGSEAVVTAFAHGFDSNGLRLAVLGARRRHFNINSFASVGVSKP